MSLFQKSSSHLYLNTLKATSLVAVSFIALSTANQAYAQCTPVEAGNDVITCTGK